MGSGLKKGEPKMTRKGHKVRCQHCFKQYSPYQCLFQCHRHDASLIFSPTRFEKRKGFADFVWAFCHECEGLTRYRRCRFCRNPVPHYAGRFRNSTIAIAGARGSGKTVYSLALLEYLQRRSASSFPGLVPMFEDDRSFELFKKQYTPLVKEGRLPDATFFSAEAPEPEPINVRLYGASGKSTERVFLVMYDAPGELFRSFENVSYVRYLAAARHIILTIDITQIRKYESEPSLRDLLADAQPDRVLNVMSTSIRNELGLDENTRIPKRLCVMLTKADLHLYSEHPELKPQEVTPDFPLDRKRKHISYVSRRCREILTEMDQHSFLAMADTEFSKVSFFASSAMLDAESARPRLDGQGVADPLCMIYRN